MNTFAWNDLTFNITLDISADNWRPARDHLQRLRTGGTSWYYCWELVTASDRPTSPSKGMIGENPRPTDVAKSSVTASQKGYQKQETTYYVTAIVTYPRGVEHNVTHYRNCSLMLQGYSRYSSAKANLKHIPFGKQKQVHVSKFHHGRYCIDTPEFEYNRDVGLPLLLTGCGLLSLMFASICLVGCRDEQLTGNTAVETAIVADPSTGSSDGVELTNRTAPLGMDPQPVAV
jgi:hypothetical protein